MTRIQKTLESGITYANWTIDRAFGIELTGVADPTTLRSMLVAMFNALTESQQLRILAALGWEPVPSTVQPAPASA